LQTGEYYSKGKFLLSGEYLVLYGAKALAVPLKLGQAMTVSETEEPGIIHWETYVLGNIWFTGTFRLEDLEILYASDEETGNFIKKLLSAGIKLQPLLLLDKQGFKIENRIEFDIRWGLGSSSSLVSNMALWLGISPFRLYRELFQGSGYDVFCSRASAPILYQLKGDLPVYLETTFQPSFKDQIYFAYLGTKQDSQKSLDHFKGKMVPGNRTISLISDLTLSMLKTTSLDEFMSVMRLHEDVISSVLGMKKVKQQLFSDFPGEIKSLGAWGGDFVMAVSKAADNEVMDYFRSKNLETIFGWKEIVY
jgi:mevalonate kinase